MVGMAGSGKSYLTKALSELSQSHRYNVVTVNLDPGAFNLVYEPDVDIRDYVKLEGVMQQYNLGPNGALIASSDLVALNLDKVKEEIESYKPEITIVDTPGQMELFAFRESGSVVVNTLKDENSYIAFLMDSNYVKTPTNFASALFISAAVQFRFDIPLLHVLNKIDLIDKDELSNLIEWTKYPDLLYENFFNREKGIKGQLAEKLYGMINELDAFSKLIPTSAKESIGIDDLYAIIEEVYPADE